MKRKETVYKTRLNVIKQSFAAVSALSSKLVFVCNKLVYFTKTRTRYRARTRTGTRTMNSSTARTRTRSRAMADNRTRCRA
jgi:hypothetical protein